MDDYSVMVRSNGEAYGVYLVRQEDALVSSQFVVHSFPFGHAIEGNRDQARNDANEFARRLRNFLNLNSADLAVA